MAEEYYIAFCIHPIGFFFFKQKNMHDYKSALRMKMHWLYLLRAPSHNQLKSNAFTMIFLILQYIAIVVNIVLNLILQDIHKPIPPF